MVPPAAEHILLDTNVLLAATDTARAEHAAALRVLNEWPGSTGYTCGQILREYLVVATRPTDVNGFGLSTDDGLRNVAALRERLRFLNESERVHARLVELLAATPCTGVSSHDANVVAVALAHGVGTIVTANVADFARFGAAIQVVPLARC